MVATLPKGWAEAKSPSIPAADRNAHRRRSLPIRGLSNRLSLDLPSRHPLNFNLPVSR
jgi:hypothetical protein